MKNYRYRKKIDEWLGKCYQDDKYVQEIKRLKKEIDRLNLFMVNAFSVTRSPY